MITSSTARMIVAEGDGFRLTAQASLPTVDCASFVWLTWDWKDGRPPDSIPLVGSEVTRLGRFLTDVGDYWRKETA